MRTSRNAVNTAFAQNRNKPAEDAIGERGLQSHEERHLPCETVPPESFTTESRCASPADFIDST